MHQKKQLDRAVHFISDIFTPVLPVITAAGILKALTLLAGDFGLLASDGSTYTILTNISSAGFYFLPLYLTFSAAKRSGGNPYLAMFLAAVLLYPDFVNEVATGDTLTFFHLPVRAHTYSSTVVPAFLIGIGSARVEQVFQKFVPKIISFFAVPLLTTLVAAPLIIVVLGPAGIVLGDILSDGLIQLFDVIGWPAIAILGGIGPLLVTGGLSLAFLPQSLTSIAKTGCDPFSRPAFLCTNFAIAGATLAVGFKTRQKETKSLAFQVGVVALMGVTEPSIYGILLPLKRPFLMSMIGSFTGAVFAGITGVQSIAYASPSVITFPIFIGSSFLFALISAVISVAVSFLLTFLIGFGDAPLSHAAETETSGNVKEALV